MPIKIPNDLPASKILKDENIFVMDENRALAQQIRPLQLLILNVMPTKIVTETQLLRMLSNTPLQIEVDWIHMASHESKNTSQEHLLAFYKTFDEMFNDDKIVSPEEREQINFQVSLIGKMIEAREKKGLSQRDLAELSGVKQPAIARLESMKSTPQIDTLLKILAPLGYTLSITPIENKR